MSYLPLLSFGPSTIVIGSAFLLLRLSASECLTSFADYMTGFSHGLTREFDAVSVVNDALKDCVGEGWIANDFVPSVDGQLTGD
jgi:hypothetical protein